MKRNKILKLISDYHPKYQEEIPFKEKTLTFIIQNENCFERSLESGHITASSWLLNYTGESALLMHHAKLNIWCQLGGHCDGNEDVLAVAIKEAQEESGISDIIPVSNEIFDMDIHLIPSSKNIKEHLHYDIRFILQVREEKEAISNGESKELRWINKNKEQLPSKENSIIRMHEKWIKLTSQELRL